MFVTESHHILSGENSHKNFIVRDEKIRFINI